MNDKSKILVTSALPYANGSIHLGHLAGAYLPADIYVRYQRAKKRDIIYICGSDEHGVPITIAAEKQGISPQKVVDKYPDNKYAAESQFMIGFVYANSAVDTLKARGAYNTFLERYPDHELVSSVQFELKYLGKDINQIPNLMQQQDQDMTQEEENPES